MTFGLILVTGCSKEGTSDQIEQQETQTDYVLKQSNGAFVWEAIEVDLPMDNATTAGNHARGESAHAHGDYTGFGGSTTISFSGTENNGGAHGSAEVWQAGGPFEAHFAMETTSMVVDGNYAIYGGVITEVFVNTFPPPPPPPPCPTFPNCPPPPPCNPNSVGNYIYFTVYDNGQGNNAPADQYLGLTQSCFVKSDGGVSFPWFIFGQPSDVMNSSDKIKVN